MKNPPTNPEAPGFGGSCFKKDILNMVYLCEFYGLQEVADYWAHVVEINDYQVDRFVRNLLVHLFNTVADKRIAILGFAFKADTGDTRESPAIRVCRKLVEERARLVISDPQALENARRDLADVADRIEFEPDPYVATQDAHAIALLTDWAEYRHLDYERIFKGMVQPAFVFDGRNLLDHHKLYEIGFNVYPTGKAPMSHL
jgi:UDPglucose 6-dehydrogenase